LLSIPIERRREVIFRKSGGERLWLHRYKKRDLGHPADLDEMTFRFNNRFNPYLFRDTLLKLIKAPVLEYK
jgi:hypothetical protein